MVNCCGHEMSSSVSDQCQQPLMMLAPDLVDAGDLRCSAVWLCGIAICVFIETEEASYVGGASPWYHWRRGAWGEKLGRT